jgi:hypothetical protein
MITNWISSNWENVLKAIPIILGAIATIYQFRGKIPESRSQLKLDLEILQLIPAVDDPSHKMLKQSIDARIARIYSDATSGSATGEIELEGPNLKWYQRLKWGPLIYGSLLLMVFGLWTFSLYNRGSWWALATGFVAFGGFGNVLIAFNSLVNPTNESAPKPKRAGLATVEAE